MQLTTTHYIKLAITAWYIMVWLRPSFRKMWNETYQRTQAFPKGIQIIVMPLIMAVAPAIMGIFEVVMLVMRIIKASSDLAFEAIKAVVYIISPGMAVRLLKWQNRRLNRKRTKLMADNSAMKQRMEQMLRDLEQKAKHDTE